MWRGMTLSLRPKQEAAVAFMSEVGRSILADPPGEGKTPTTLTWLRREEAQRTIIVVPNGAIIQHWVRQAKLWWPEATLIPYTAGPSKRPHLRYQFQDSEGPVALVMTYAMMRQDQEALIRNRFTHAVWDEAHRLKNRTAQQTKCAWLIANRTDKVVLLTGTPVLNRADELWAQAKTLYPGTYRSWVRWTDEHFYIEQRYFGGPRPVRIVSDLLPGHAEKVRDEMSGFLLQRPAEPFGEEPKIIHVPVELDKAERAAYEKMYAAAWVELQEEVVAANGSLAQITRLRQLASDWTMLDSSLTKSSKVCRVADLAAELIVAGEHVVVFSDFKQTLRSIAAELTAMATKEQPFPWLMFTGDETQKQREYALSSFGVRPAVMLGTHAALGEGVDGLQHHARYAIMAARDWTPARNEQAIGRVQRRGQERQVVVYHVYSEDTFDEDVMNILARKESVIDSVKQKVQ